MLVVFSSVERTPDSFQTPSREFLSVGVEINTALTQNSTHFSGSITRQPRLSEARQRYSTDDDHSQHADRDEKTNHFFLPPVTLFFASLRQGREIDESGL